MTSDERSVFRCIFCSWTTLARVAKSNGLLPKFSPPSPCLEGLKTLGAPKESPTPAMQFALPLTPPSNKNGV